MSSRPHLSPAGLAALVLAALALTPSFADDVVGVLNVSAGTNGVVEVEMPFAPLSADSGPSGYISGAFLGDGGDESDRLVRFDAASGSSTNAVWCTGLWLDPATWLPSSMSAFPGDTLFFLRADAEPFALSLFGRDPSASAQSLPRFASLIVDTTNATVSLGVAAAHSPYDILSSDSESASAPASGWLHLVRCASPCVWSDALPASGVLRRYLVSDATRDTDGDGLPDALESRVYGTSPYLRDTDSDGVDDGLELAWGTNPLVAEFAGAPSFVERFESDTVSEGDLAGQNGWTVSGPGFASVQRECVHGGTGALGFECDGEGESDQVTVSHAIPPQPGALWLDMHVVAGSMPEGDDAAQEARLVFCLDRAGHPVATDGASLRTNALVSVSEEDWVRCTFRVDASEGTWDAYLDGRMVFSGLALRGSGPLSALDFAGEGGFVDDIVVSCVRPEGLSSDGDAMADEWEWRVFGTLGRDGTGDFDSDGASDAAEFAAGTDPTAADTDADGMPDGWEIANGLDPLDASDASLDPDGDGYSNLVEYAYGCDPASADDFIAVGCVPGLVATYYASGSSLQAMPNFASLAPVASRVWATVDQPSVGTEWPGAPEGLVDRFAVVLEGAILVPSAGRCKFTLESDDGSRLWIDGKLVVDHGTLHSMTSKSGEAALSEGLHDIRVEYYENTGSAGLRLLWSVGGAANSVVPAECLFRASGEGAVDTDSDGMPDWWELKNGLDLTDPSDASLDPDGDGISNLDEFRNGSSPHSADTDLDGMPDAWEIANGTCPFLDDAIEDPDSDGLVNIEEYLSGSTPVAADTDGDGLTDYEERSQLGTDPTVADSVSRGSAVAEAHAGRSLALEVAEPRAFAVTAGLLHEWRDYAKNKRQKSVSNRVVFKVDGHFVAWKDVPFDCSHIVYATFYTPVLPEGGHDVSVEWCNPDFRARAELVSLSVNEICGVDFEDVVRRRNSAPEGSVSSRVSPAFVEGEARFPWLVSSGSVAVRRSGAGSWYADVPLLPGQAVSVPLSFEGLVATNAVVEWEATDLFAGAEDIALRKGSSLLFSGCPDGAEGGTVTVFTNGASACSYAPGGSSAVAFGAPGVWSVRAAWTPEGGSGEVRSGEIRVTCVGGSFPSQSPACMVGHSREWTCPGLSTNLVYETDAFTHLSMSASGKATLLVDDTRGERLVAARIFEGGPVLDVAKAEPMWAVDSFGNVAFLVESASDHDRCRCYLRQYGSPESVRFRVRSYTSSVVLDDYTTERWIGLDGFDRDGVAWFEFLKATSMAASCHTVAVFQGGVWIGDAVYGNGTLPEELR